MIISFSANATSVCDISRKFEYNGLYGLNSTSCQIEILKEPENAYLPIFYAFLALLLLQMVWNIFSSKIGNLYQLKSMLKILKCLGRKRLKKTHLHF